MGWVSVLGGYYKNNTVQTLALCALLSACGAKKTLDTHRAPTSNDTTGYITSKIATTDLEKVANAGGTYRAINAASGIYEIFDLTEAKLQQVLAGKSLQKNRFWSWPQKEPVVLGQQTPPPCEPILGKGTFDLSVKGIDQTIMQRNGQPVEFNVTFKGPRWPYKIVVQGPDTSLVTGKTSQNAPLSFVPDEMGSYQIFVVINYARAPQSICLEQGMFGVTDNKPFRGPQVVPKVADSAKREAFPHHGSMNLEKAWAAAQGAGIIVAIIDSGVHYNHPFLASNIFVNANEVADNGKDDDGNGYVDDVTGWDFVGNDNMPYDDHSHGTHVAGLVASAVGGVAPRAKILPVKATSPLGGDEASMIGAIRYAVDMGAHIINISLGSYGGVFGEVKAAMDYAKSKGVLIVVAAGNETRDIDVTPMYPASLDSTNILVVAATDLKGNLTDYTNFGKKAVDIAAPGGGVGWGSALGDASARGLTSTFYENQQNLAVVQMSGTSMASPVVAGVAALMMSKDPQYLRRPNALKNKMMLSGDIHQEYTDKVRSMRSVNVPAALGL